MELSAVHRVMLDALRTVFIWIIGLFVYYCINESAALAEPWTSYSYLELGGFVLLIVGQGTYGAMVRVPGLFYPPKSVIENDSASSKGTAEEIGSGSVVNEQEGSESRVSPQRDEIV